MLFRCDVYEEDGEIVVEVEAPGVPPEKLEVSVGEGVLRIEAALPRRPGGRWWHRRERPGGSFCREIPLPGRVSPGLADAFVRDGLLRVRLPLGRERGAGWVHLPLERDQVSAAGS
jgi:HSP20 family protein